MTNLAAEEMNSQLGILSFQAIDNRNLSFSKIGQILKLTRPRNTSINSPNSIELSKNIIYNIININSNIDVVVVKDLQTNELYEEFNDINKTFILKDNISNLYFKNRNNSNPNEYINIIVANKYEGDFIYKSGKLKLYTIEYNKYDIYNGKLLGISEKRENYLIIKLKNISDTINNHKLVKEHYNTYKELKEKYKTLINKNNDDIIEDLLEEYIENKTIKEKVKTNIDNLIKKLESIKLYEENSIKKL